MTPNKPDSSRLIDYFRPGYEPLTSLFGRVLVPENLVAMGTKYDYRVNDIIDTLDCSTLTQGKTTHESRASTSKTLDMADISVGSSTHRETMTSNVDETRLPNNLNTVTQSSRNSNSPSSESTIKSVQNNHESIKFENRSKIIDKENQRNTDEDRKEKPTSGRTYSPIRI